MAEYLIQDTTLDAIADAINAKTGGASAMTPAQMVTAIGSISGGVERTPIKLGEYTITEPINTLVITLTEEMKALEKLYVFTTDSIKKDQADWLYLSFQNGPQGYFSSRTSDEIRGVLFNISSAELGENVFPARSQFIAGQTGSTATNEGTKATVLRFFSYSSSKHLISGTVEIWG